MNKLLAISIASASIAIGAIPAVAEVDPKIHKLCLDAKDYSGCVQTQTSLSSKTEVAPIDSTKSEPIESTAWQKHLSANPNLKAWVEANPALGEESKKKWLLENETAEIEKECPEYCYFSSTYNQCSFVTTTHKVVPCSEKSNYPIQVQTRPSNNCPPGKSQYQKNALFGLIKGEKLCLSDYEVEALRQGERHRALQNFSNSMKSFSESMQPPKVVNCYSNTYGNYTSTSCY